MKPPSKLRIDVISLGFVVGLVVGSPGSACADFIFGAPTNLGPGINTSSSEGLACIVADGLSFYFTSNRPGGSGAHDLYIATRASTADNWSQPINLGPTVNSYAEEFFVCISSDGLTMYFDSTRPGGRGARDLWGTTRPSLDAPWTSPVNLGSPINSASDDVSPNLSADGLTLIFASSRAGGRGSYDLYICTRTSLDAAWSAPANLGGPVNSAHLDVAPSLSSEGLTLFFHSIRPTGFGSYDLYYSRRPTLDAPWSVPVHLGPTVNSSYVELGPSLSGDGRLLYFSEHPSQTARPGGFGSADLWQTAITPIVDFNGDERVDTEDLLVLIECWGQAEPFADIGPTPFGDGTVDAKDLEVLMSYWDQQILDPSLVAYWTLDETDGIVAYDSIGSHDGAVVGTPLWQPNAGKIGGALEFDGTYFVVADSVLNPADGPFSVFAWVKGGAPGQVIVSQEGGANWLMADPATGAVMSELKSGGRFSRVLCSEATVTDGNWHRVAFTWDGAIRGLCVDDILVVEDTQSDLAACPGGLNIGCGPDMTPGSFWAGLIDEVRIYNRAVQP